MTIVLPHSYYNRRAWLRSFWVVMCLGLGLLAGVLLRDLQVLQRMAVGSAVMAIAIIPGILRPHLAVLPMRVWNKGAQFVARAATAWITRVCFYVVVTAVGRMGSFLRLAPPVAGDSLWTPWHVGGEDRDDSGITLARSSEQDWAANFAAGARRSHSAWAWCLLPFLFALAAFETAPDMESPPPGIYTLY